ncbi:MAG: hypothetical protein PHI29_13320 [Gallionella sp.]|nr:hypothetical protein [Gallionella sp.]
MQWLSDKIDGLLSWFAEGIKQIFLAIIDLFKDIFLWIFDALLTGVAAVISVIPVPDFMAHGFTPLFSSLPAPLIYLLVQTGVPQAISVVGVGVIFRLTRKLLTLGQW